MRGVLGMHLVRGWFYIRPTTTTVKVVESRCGGATYCLNPFRSSFSLPHKFLILSRCFLEAKETF